MPKIYPKETFKTLVLSIITTFYWIVIGITVIVMLTSCQSVKYVPVETVKYDSIYIAKHDTVSITQVKHEKEIVIQKDSVVVKVDENGKILQKEIFHNRQTIKELSDSLAHYRALADSLANVKQNTQEVIKEVEKPLSTWQQRFIAIGHWAVGIIVCVLLASIVWVMVNLRKKFKRTVI